MERKDMVCGCVVEEYGEEIYVYFLCQHHKNRYYENPRRFLEMVKEYKDLLYVE